ncbi:MAG TPA: ATP-binding protein [Rectinemataceae bacterium]|nr:ATP-binding protein [Rectinemataceae bacterium]
MRGLELRGVTASYRETTALDEFNLVVASGEVHAIIGERRAGKSCVVSLLEGKMTLVKGAILIDEAPLTKRNPKTMALARIGVFHQTQNIIPTLLPWENIMAGRMPIGFSSRHMRDEIEAFILSLCQKWGLHPDLRLPTHRLTRIESTVIELGRALAFNPKILILDEPSGRFTADEMQVLYSVLAERRSGEEAILYAASNVDEVLRIADVISIIKAGKIVETQPARSLDREDIVDLAYSFNESREELFSKNIRLLKYKKYNEEIVSNLPLGTVFFDGEGEIYLSNQSACDIMCTDQKTMIPASQAGEPMTAMPLTTMALRNGFDEKRLGLIMDSIRSGMPAKWKQWPTAKGRFVNVMTYPFHDSLKQLFGTILVLQDVTEERATRDYLARVDRASSIAQLATGIVHEVNNPLGIISNYVELLLMKTKDEYARERLEIIRNEIQRIHGSMLNLLSFSSVDSSALSPHDISAVIKDSLALLEYEAERLGINLEADLPDEPVMLRIDPARIKQVLINLLMNALDVAGQCGSIVVRLWKQADSSALLQVRDSGPGIPADKIANLFTPFLSEKSGNGHAGLGLSICKHIIEVHGGRIWCESEPGNTAFFIELPREGPRQGKGPPDTR